MALSVGRGENKQKLLKILVFVPSGSIVGLDSQCQGANKNGHLKTFRTRKPTVWPHGGWSALTVAISSLRYVVVLAGGRARPRGRGAGALTMTLSASI